MMRTNSFLTRGPHLARFVSTRVSKRQESDFVARRYKWRESLRADRLAFIKGEGLGANAEIAEEKERRKEGHRLEVDPAAVAAREERRIQRQQKHLAMLGEVQERKAVRQAAKHQIWEQRQAVNAARRAEELAAVEAAAANWVNESTLDEAVERCVDAFFIAGDADRHSSAFHTTVKGKEMRTSQ